MMGSVEEEFFFLLKKNLSGLNFGAQFENIFMFLLQLLLLLLQLLLVVKMLLLLLFLLDLKKILSYYNFIRF